MNRLFFGVLAIAAAGITALNASRAPEPVLADLAPCVEAPRTYSVAELLRAIRLVECGDAADPPDGDGGRSLGPYQIRLGYFVDSGVRGAHRDCRDVLKAERVVVAYMRRYLPGVLRDGMSLADCEAVARTHNGGPNGRRKESTENYWRKVRAALGA